MAGASSRRILPWILVVLLTGLTVALVWRGWSFYKLSMEDRVVHPDFRKLRSSGTIGNGYGFVAATLVVLNLSYLVRRQLAGSRLGSMKVWLDLHVFTGMAAAILAAFHSAFQVRTPITKLGVVALMVVVVTGLIGRFLHTLAPASDGRRLRDALDAVETALPGTRPRLVAAIDALPAPELPANASLLRSLLWIPRWRKNARQRRETLELVLPPRRDQDRPTRRAIKELYKQAALDARASGMAALLRSWRGLHRFFALLMLAVVLFHAAVAWHYGYRWIFT